MPNPLTPPIPSDSPRPTASSSGDLRSLLEGVAVGVVYGLFLRAYQFVLTQPDRLRWQRVIHVDIVMTMAFLAGGPLLIGFLTVRRAELRQPAAFWRWIFLPWLAVTVMMGFTALLAWEGAICVIMALPIALLFASLGGVIAGLLTRRRRIAAAPTVCVALLPFLLAPAESLRPAPLQTRTVQNTILIHAPASVVWHNIERVPPIAPSELHTTWAQRIGFPRPVEATLSYEGIGGVRHASFERGLLFLETVTAWDPGHRLAFTIKADTEHIPPTTLDEHVTIGGRYFDVLDGEYALEPLPNGDTLLHLTSHQRLTTDFNGYAGLWSDAVMSNLQSSILTVIGHRCETP